MLFFYKKQILSDFIHTLSDPSVDCKLDKMSRLLHHQSFLPSISSEDSNYPPPVQSTPGVGVQSESSNTPQETALKRMVAFSYDAQTQL